MMDFDSRFYLEEAGKKADEDVDLAGCALALAALQHEGISCDRYFSHLKRLARDTKTRYQKLLDAGGEDNAETQLAALKHVVSDQYGYDGDRENYDNLENADLIRVIDRGKGLPISLAIIYIHAGSAQGWNVAGLNMPGHFICRIEKKGRRIIFDPFEDCKILAAQDLRFLLKKYLGPDAELSADYYNPCSNREILMRLQNNLKFRLIETEQYKEALKIVHEMKLFNPDEKRLLLDEGVLCAKTEQPKAAISVLNEYIGRTSNPSERREAEMLLQKVKESLN